MLAVILDVVDSRSHSDQQRLLTGVAAMARQYLEESGTARSTGPTIGDELQALYADGDRGRAVRDMARLRLALRLAPPSAEPVDVRVGFGRGEVTSAAAAAAAPDADAAHAAAPGQSGPAWWAARAALDRVARHRNAWPTLGWWYDGPDAPVMQAALVGLDTLWNRLDQVDLRAAAGLLDGSTAAALADDLGLSRSTLSERLHGHGVYGWVRALETLAAVGRPEEEDS